MTAVSALPDYFTWRFAGIQWLRAIAAILVVFEHVKNDISVNYLHQTPSESYLSIFPFSAGVDIFFVISGFIMAHSSSALFGAKNGWWRFLVRRVARVGPLYWLITSIMMVLFLTVGKSDWDKVPLGRLVASYVFIPTPNPVGAVLPILSVGWTLNYEMAFYVIFSIFIGLKQKSALIGTCLFLIALACYGALVQPEMVALQFWSNSIILEFVGGIGIYGLYRSGLRLPASVRIGLVIAALVALSANVSPVELDRERWFLWGVPAFLVLLAVVCGRERRKSAAKDDLANLAGDLSYSVYLVHPLVIVLVSKLTQLTLPASSLVWFGAFPAAVVTATLAASVILHYFVERPTLRLARRLTGVRVEQGAGAPPGP